MTRSRRPSRFLRQHIGGDRSDSSKKNERAAHDEHLKYEFGGGDVSTWCASPGIPSRHSWARPTENRVPVSDSRWLRLAHRSLHKYCRAQATGEPCSPRRIAAESAAHNDAPPAQQCPAG